MLLLYALRIVLPQHAKLLSAMQTGNQGISFQREQGLKPAHAGLGADISKTELQRYSQVCTS